jgi:uncharacterized protein (TIGR03437 family)
MPSFTFLLVLAADLTPQPVPAVTTKPVQIGFERASAPFAYIHRQAYLAIGLDRLRISPLGIDISFLNAASGSGGIVGGPTLPGLIRTYPGGVAQPHLESINFNPYADFSFQFAVASPGRVHWRIQCGTSSCNWAALEFEIPRNVVHDQTGKLNHSLPIPGAPTYRLEPSLPIPQLYLDGVRHILNPDYTPPVVLSCVASPINFQHLFALSPGMFVTLFGERMGSAGTRVFLNGWEAPVLYSSPGQVNIVVPYELPTGQPVDVEVQSAGFPSRTLRVNRTEATNLQLFPVVLNQDGTLNSAQNPAARNSIVILWGTGAGNTNPPAATGEILPLAPRPRELPLEVSASGVFRLEVLYAGAAPGFIAGLTQINVKLHPGIIAPDGIARLTAFVGGTPDSVLVHVQPQ